MSPIFENFRFFRFILSYTYAQNVPTLQPFTTKILSSGELADKAPVKNHFDKIMAVDANEKLLLQGKFLGELEALARKAINTETQNQILLKEQGRLENEKNIMCQNSLRVKAVPYLLMKLELYQGHWDMSGLNSDDFATLTYDSPKDLDEQSRSNYKSNTKRWDRILTSSKDPGALKFKERLLKAFPGIALPQSAKHIGLAITLLNNAKHRAAVADAGINIIADADEMVNALSEWKSLRDPNLLLCVKMFEVTTGL